MTDEVLSELISGDVSAALEKNEDIIVKSLAECADEDVRMDPTIARMVIKAIGLSVQLSTMVIIRELEVAGILRLPDDGTPLLHLVEEESP